MTGLHCVRHDSVTLTTMAKKNPPRTPNESDVREFNKWATSPAGWFARAEQLHQSSELLWSPISRLFDMERRRERADPNAGLHAPAYMLVAGFAIEAMLKAAAIQTELNAGGIDRVVVPGSSQEPGMFLALLTPQGCRCCRDAPVDGRTGSKGSQLP